MNFKANQTKELKYVTKGSDLQQPLQTMGDALKSLSSFALFGTKQKDLEKEIEELEKGIGTKSISTLKKINGNFPNWVGNEKQQNQNCFLESIERYSISKSSLEFYSQELETLKQQPPSNK
ncbi:hypothetical protein M0812_06270 [Anaeramoeba flamelloides]|uniref:Uncharacterized protein n=1 Tax=Anaeramoeba flamelloides TaxID=1746091 RepID=A0AAV8AB94_9EUKA|nr:hypothetical protein M0812_06270 [Anaeramoeba flamelloides]